LEKPLPAIAWWFDVGTELTLKWPGPPADETATAALVKSAYIERLSAPGKAVLFARAMQADPVETELYERLRRGERFLYVHADDGRDGSLFFGLPAPGTVTPAPRTSATEMSFALRASRAEWMLVSEKWYPGWQAFVAGSWRDAERANLGFLAVEVTGRDDVVLRYRPSWLVPGFAAALLGLGTGMLLRFRSRRVARHGDDVVVADQPQIGGP
jgi:hypothetical protein